MGGHLCGLSQCDSGIDWGQLWHHLIFLLAILIPACASSSPAFLMMYSAYKLNKQGNNIQPWHTLFPVWNQSAVPCLVLTIASWPAYRLLRRQVRWSGIPISFRIFHSLLWSISMHKRILYSSNTSPVPCSSKSKSRSMESLGLGPLCYLWSPFPWNKAVIIITEFSFKNYSG